jgi:von Willebrand factor type A domain
MGSKDTIRENPLSICAKTGPVSLCMKFLIVILLVIGFATAQEVPNTTFRTQATTVLVPALVRDKTGEPVYGLTAKDFVIEDDGVAQASALDEAAESEPVSLVVAIQCGGRADYELPRMKGLPAMLQPLLAQPQSTVALIAFDSQVHLVENFTADQDTVQKDLRALRPGDDGAAILDAVNESVRLFEEVPQNRKRVLLLISETRDHGSHSAKVNDVIRAIGNSNAASTRWRFRPRNPTSSILCVAPTIPTFIRSGPKCIRNPTWRLPSCSWWRPCARIPPGKSLP